MNTRQKVLEDALKCVNGEREKQYGNPEDNFKRIAELWSDYLSMLFDDVVIELEPIDVAKMMVLFKIARSMGSQDKMDNYVDMIGYSACAAEILEKETKMAESRSCSKKASDNIRDFFERLAPGTVTNKEEFEKRCNHIEVADECKECDYAEKCMGTGVCLKDTEKKCLKDKPDYKCNRKDCGQFDACMAAYQHYICNKTKEASEAIDECMCENSCDEKANAFDHYCTNVLLDKNDPYGYAHDKLANYVSTKAKEEHIPLDNLKSINRKFPRELSDYLDQASTDCVMNGKRFLDCYKEIDELFAKYKPDVKKYNSSWKAYANVSDYITSSSCKANVNPVDVVNYLAENEHAPSKMSDLLMTGKLKFDDVASYIDDAINEVKKKEKDADNN